jgi:hypothetical protein
MYPSVFEHKRKSRSLAGQAKRSPECTTRARLLLLGAVQLISYCLFPTALLFVHVWLQLGTLALLPFMEAEMTAPSAEHQLHLHDSCREQLQGNADHCFAACKSLMSTGEMAVTRDRCHDG